MAGNVNPLQPLGVYVEALGTGYEMEVVSVGGASVTLKLIGISDKMLAKAYGECMRELAKHYASTAIPGDARTPGRIVVPH